jgi:hypothetical protein
LLLELGKKEKIYIELNFAKNTTTCGLCGISIAALSEPTVNFFLLHIYRYVDTVVSIYVHKLGVNICLESSP